MQLICSSTKKEVYTLSVRKILILLFPTLKHNSQIINEEKVLLRIVMSYTNGLDNPL